MNIEEGNGFTGSLSSVFCVGDEPYRIILFPTSLSFIIGWWINFAPALLSGSFFQDFSWVIVGKLALFSFTRYFRQLYFIPFMTLHLVIQFLPHASTIYAEKSHFACAPVFVSSPKADLQLSTRMTSPSFYLFWCEFIFAHKRSQSTAVYSYLI